jgi:hypothetical protein
LKSLLIDKDKAEVVKVDAEVRNESVVVNVRVEKLKLMMNVVVLC